jgi:large subunit ribosomal protein L18
MSNLKELGRVARHERIRRKITGTAERPRVVVHRSLMSLQAQAIDDVSHKTIAACSSLSKEFLKQVAQKGKILVAEKLGEAFAADLKKKGIKQIAFDRGGYLYHGRVKAFADSIRKGGIQF